jgi:hypothetical protein
MGGALYRTSEPLSPSWRAAAAEAWAMTVERLGARKTFECLGARRTVERQALPEARESSALPETVERQAQGATVWEPGGLESPSAQRSFPEDCRAWTIPRGLGVRSAQESSRVVGAPRGSQGYGKGVLSCGELFVREHLRDQTADAIMNHGVPFPNLCTIGPG